MGNALFIVWRETIEAMLVIGILHGWIASRPTARAGFPWLWGGVAAGLALAWFLAFAIMGIETWASTSVLDWFQAFMPLVACALIFQMVFWMRRHSAGLKRELETGMENAARQSNWLGMAVLAAVAVGREGAEAVVFLFGSVESGSGGRQITLGGLAGFALALAAYWLLSRGSRFISWRVFFRATEILLLLLGGALLVDGTEKLIGLEALPALADPLWNTTTMLDDSTRVGGLVAAFSGYRAVPSGMAYLLLVAYWALAIAMLRMLKPTRPKV